MKGLLEAVQKKKEKLKPVESITDRSQPNLQFVEKDSKFQEENDKRREYYFQSTIDQWYETIKEYTFESSILPITREEALFIIQSCQEIHNKNIETFDEIPNGLKSLEEKIDEIIQTKFFPKYSAVFVKLSTRSPKDSKTLFRKAETAFQNRSDMINTSNYNSRLIAFYEEITRANAVTSGKDALNLLLDSWRIADDLMYALGIDDISKIEKVTENFKIETKEFPISLVIRGFNPKILPETEFRGFIWNHRLTCVGQYHHALYYPEKIVGRMDQIIADCQAFVNDILLNKNNRSNSSMLPIPNAMLDLAWLGPGEVILVEINPLMEGLSSFQGSMGLFDYYRDNALITGQLDENSSFEFRMRTMEESREEMIGHLPPEWKRNIIS